MFSLLRSYLEYDKKSVKRMWLNGVRKFAIFHQFNFDRSHEYVKSFTCSTAPTLSYGAFFVNRRLQFYDFIQQQLLFEINFPNAGVYRLKEELMIRVNQSVRPARVRDVLFKEMLIQ